MSSADALYWCHQCNVETRPPPGDDVLCTFCHQGFVEELSGTEVEPGVPFSALPLVFNSFLRRPSPSSMGASGNRSIADSPSSPLQSQDPASPGANQTDQQSHRPRLLSGQLSGVPSLLETMMQVLDEMNTPGPNASRLVSGGLGEHATQGVSMRDQPGSGEMRDESSHRSEEQPHSPRPDGEDRGRALFLSPTLILHGGAHNGFGSLEVFVDHGLGMGPQMVPNHMRDYFFGPDLDRLIQLLAENDTNRYGTPPASKTEVEKLPKINITEEHLGSDLSSQCAVCKDRFELDVEVNQMPCKHIYHPDCLLPWLEQHNSCPICRFELPTDDADYEARKAQINSGNTIASSLGRQESGGSGVADVRASGPPNEEPHPNVTSGQFTLWGMPSTGFDVSTLLTGSVNRSGQSGDTLNDGQQIGSGQEQGATTEGGTRGAIPVQWLFRLFSSGNLLGEDDESNDGNQSPDNSHRRDAPNS